MSPPVTPAVTMPAAAAAVTTATKHRRLSTASFKNPNDWAPFESKEEFNMDVTLLLIFIACFVVGAFFFNYIINRFLNHSTREARRRKQINLQEMAKSSGPTLEFSPDIKMASTDKCCPICLSEFVDGERIRVLPKCSHGFHVNCIEKWLLSYHNTCPTCRTHCMNITVPELDAMATNFHGGHVVGDGVEFNVLDDDVLETGAADIPILTVQQQQENSTATIGSSSSAAATTTAD